MIQPGGGAGVLAAAPPPREARVRSVLRVLAVARGSRTAKWLRRIRGVFPLTGIGLCTLAAAGGTWMYSWDREQDYILYMVARAGFALVTLLLVLVMLSALLLRRRLHAARTPESLRLETETWQPTGFRVAIPRWLPCVEVVWELLGENGRPLAVDLAPAREGAFLAETVRPRRRGLHGTIHRRFHVRDVLGVAGIDLEATEAVPVRILPARAGLESLPVLVALLASDEISDPRGEPFGDRVDMRQYVRGDPPRLILWKVFARTRKLMVRVPERAITAQPRTCAWLVGGPQDEAAAALARVVLERSLLGDGWRFGADVPAESSETERRDAGACGASHLQAALDLVARSGGVDGSATRDPQAFRRFLERAEHDGYVCCLIFAPPGCGPWMEAVEEASRRSRIRLYTFMGVESMLGSAPRARWQRLLTVGPPALAAVSREDLGRAFDGWRPVAASVFAVERGTGRVWDGLPPLQESPRARGASS